MQKLPPRGIDRLLRRARRKRNECLITADVVDDEAARETQDAD